MSDVAIVGAGPVGLLLALLLGRQGWRVDVLERQAVPYDRPRAVHIDHEVARILQSVGVMDDLAPLTEAMDAYEWRNAAGATLLCLGDDGALGASGWPVSIMFAQPDLERLIEAAIAALDNVTVRRGVDVTDVATIDARWIVGCDGAASTLRTAIGAPVADLGYDFDWLVVDVVPAETRRWRPLNVQVCDPARPTTAVSGGPGRRRFEFMRLPGESLDSLLQPETAWRLLGPWGLTPANATLLRHAAYTFHARLAERWRRGPLLIAGDAAHQMPPFAGQGLCSGLRDAANLAWKLDLVLAGRAPDDLLDTYQSERSTQVRAEIDFSVDLGKIICILDPTEAAARDEGMIPAAAAAGPMAIPPGPPLGPGITLAGDPNAGRLAVQGIVARGPRRGRFDDVVGAGWTLLSPLGDPGLGLPEWWTSIGGRSCDVGVAADVEGSYAAWFAGLGAGVALVRPDFYVFGTAADLAGAPGLVDALGVALASRH